jgi:two-component system response regulator YesN
MKFFTCTLALLLAASSWLAQPTMTSQSAAGKSAFARRSCPRRGSGSRVAKAPRRILVADDDVTLQDVLTFFLGKEYEVRPATTGADALARLCHEPVDLVVLDHRLPDRSGLDILAELKSIRPSLPVVMLTGYGSEWICAAAFKLGVADYLRKPVNAVDLVGAVHRILPPGPERRGFSRDGPMLRGLRAPLCTPIQRAMGLIQQRYWEQLSLSGLAGQVGMSKYRLSHRFREEIGITFRDYLLRVRIEQAKVLLADHVSISEVAQNVGFGDLPHFDKVFKRYVGSSPSAYRSLLLSRSNG